MIGRSISQSTWRQVFVGARMTVGAAVVAGLMALSAPAPVQALSITTNLPAGAETGAPVVDLLAGPYSFHADFVDADNAGTFTFNFENSSLTQLALALKNSTINQLSGLFFTDGVTTTFDGVARNTPQGDFDAFQMSALVNPGETVSLVYNFGNPVGTSSAGPDIDFLISASVVPLPAGLVLFLSGLAGIGFLGRYKAKRRVAEIV